MNEPMLNVAGKTVLIIDDIMSARIVLVDMLKDIGFQKWLEAKNGTEALQLIESNRVQLIFCDFFMDGMNGMQFLQALKDKYGEATPPVIFVSSIGDVESVDAVLKLGAADYLVKPLNFRKLRSKVSTALAASQADAMPATASE